jgi:hypothetical protein
MILQFKICLLQSRIYDKKILKYREQNRKFYLLFCVNVVVCIRKVPYLFSEQRDQTERRKNYSRQFIL